MGLGHGSHHLLVSQLGQVMVELDTLRRYGIGFQMTARGRVYWDWLMVRLYGYG